MHLNGKINTLLYACEFLSDQGVQDSSVAIYSTVMCSSAQCTVLFIDLLQYLVLQNTWEHYGGEGRRVFGFAIRRFVAEANAKFTASDIALEGLTFLGMAGLIDPPRFAKCWIVQLSTEALVVVFIL